MSIKGTMTENEIQNAIREEWKQKGWDWDTHTGQATKRLLPITSAIMARELAEFKTMVQGLTDNISIVGMISDRAKDAVMLYNALKRSGMSEDGLNYAVHAFLVGDKNFEYHPNIKIREDQSE